MTYQLYLCNPFTHHIYLRNRLYTIYIFFISLFEDVHLKVKAKQKTRQGKILTVDAKPVYKDGERQTVASCETRLTGKLSKFKFHTPVHIGLLFFFRYASIKLYNCLLYTLQEYLHKRNPGNKKPPMIDYQA